MSRLGVLQVGPKRAVRAIGSLSAISLAHCNRERVEFVEEQSEILVRVGRKRIAGELDKCSVSLAILSGCRVDEAMSDRNAAEVFICDRNRVAERVEENRI